MLIRDRILDFRRVPASRLRPNPRNWRTHPAAQQEAMRGMLAEIGYADALLVRERDDGTLELIDGHLRAELSPASEVPVLVLDLDDAEAAQLLALHDPLAAMADMNQELLDDLLAEVETRNEALRKELDALASPIDVQPVNDETTEARIPDIYQVVVECRSEEEQQTVYESLKAEGHRCRLMSL
jgi:ParB-like chromosome segregation protein Spo0J